MVTFVYHSHPADDNFQWRKRVKNDIMFIILNVWGIGTCADLTMP